MSDAPRISLIIATYNRGPSLVRTLVSVAAQELTTDLWEAVVVNNNSTDDTARRFSEFADSHPLLNLRIENEQQQGLSPARNRGIVESRGEIVVVIDDDQLINSDFLGCYLRFFDAHPAVAAAGGVITPHYEAAVPRWMTKYTERPIAGTLRLGSRNREFPANRYPGGGNMAVRRAALDRYGAFDPALGRTGSALLGGEEKDLFSRLRGAGEQVWYVPGAVVTHIIPPEKLTSGYLMKLARMTGVSEYRRTKNVGYAARLISEAVKWCATIALLVFYTLTLRPIKGWYLVKMRLQITKGLLSGR